jgi:hypothetical protein
MRPRREGTTLPRQRCPVQACNCLVALPAIESLAEYPPCYIFELGPSKRIFRDSNPDLRCVTITLNTLGPIANNIAPCYIFELGPSKRIFRDSNPDLRCVTITLNTLGSIDNKEGLSSSAVSFFKRSIAPPLHPLGPCPPKVCSLSRSTQPLPSPRQ